MQTRGAQTAVTSDGREGASPSPGTTLDAARQEWTTDLSPADFMAALAEARTLALDEVKAAVEGFDTPLVGHRVGFVAKSAVLAAIEALR